MSRIKSPTGTTEVSVGEHRYEADIDGTITLPDEDASAVLASDAGFTVVDEVVAPSQKQPLAKNATMRAPEGAESVSFAGLDYHVDPDGTIAVPVEAVNDLIGHGYIPIDAAPAVILDAPVHP